MPNGLPLSATPAVQAFLTKLRTDLASRLAGQLSRTAGLLDCGFESEQVANAVDGYLALQKSLGQPVRSCTIYKLRIGVIRNDPGEGPKPGPHIAVLLALPDHYILIDATHLQFDLPVAVTHADSKTLRTQYSALFSGFQHFTFYDRPLEPVLMAWRNFISSKPYVRYVTGVEVLDKDALGLGR